MGEDVAKKAFPGRSRSCVVSGRMSSNNWISLSIEDMERDQGVVNESSFWTRGAWQAFHGRWMLYCGRKEGRLRHAKWDPVESVRGYQL